MKAGAIASIAPDEEQWPKSPEADAVRLGLFALVRQKGYEPLAAAIQDGSGRVSGWWPVAYALQRINDRRAIPALQQLARTPGRYTRAFAARGLGALKDAGSAPLLLSMLEQSKNDPVVAPSVVRALGQVGAPEAAEPLVAVLGAEKTDPNLRLEAVTALAALKSQAALPYIQELLTDDWPTLRAAAVRATRGDRAGRLPRDPLGHGTGSAVGRARGDRRRPAVDGAAGRGRAAARAARRPGQAGRPRGDRRAWRS